MFKIYQEKEKKSNNLKTKKDIRHFLFCPLFVLENYNQLHPVQYKSYLTLKNLFQ